MLKHLGFFFFFFFFFFNFSFAAAAKSLQSCPTLCDPIDGSPPGSPVPGIFQARTLEWVAISSSNAWKWKVKGKSLSRVRLLVTPWTTAYQTPPSMGFSRQEYWSGVPLPSPLGDNSKGGKLLVWELRQESRILYTQMTTCKVYANELPNIYFHNTHQTKLWGVQVKMRRRGKPPRKK